MTFKLSMVASLYSNGLVRNVYYAAANSFAGQANAAYQKQQRGLLAATRSEAAARALPELMATFETAATAFWSVIAVAGSNGVQLDSESILDFVSSGTSKPRSNEVLTEYARLTKQSLAAVQKRDDENRQKKIERAKANQGGFLAAMSDAEWNHKASDPTIPATKLNEALLKTQNFVMGWENTEKATAELTLLSRDQEVIERLLDKEAEQEEAQPSAAVIALDERLASGADLTAAQQSGK